MEVYFSIVVWDGFNISTQIQSACETDFMHQGDFIHKGRMLCIRYRRREGFDASDTEGEKDLMHQKQGERRI